MNSSMACRYPRWASGQVRLLRTAALAWSRSGSRRIVLGTLRFFFGGRSFFMASGPPRMLTTNGTRNPPVYSVRVRRDTPNVSTCSCRIVTNHKATQCDLPSCPKFKGVALRQLPTGLCRKPLGKSECKRLRLLRSNPTGCAVRKPHVFGSASIRRNLGRAPGNAR